MLVADLLPLYAPYGHCVCHVQVLLVSAQHALLSRLVLQGKADKHVASRFGRLAFGSRANKFPPHEHRVAAGEMLIASGLAELEETVLAFLYAHSGSLKMLALLDDIVRMLHQVRFYTWSCNLLDYLAVLSPPTCVHNWHCLF